MRAIEERMAREAEESAAVEALRREAEATQPMPEETELLSFEDLAQDEEPEEIVELSSDSVEEREAVQPLEEVPSSRTDRRDRRRTAKHRRSSNRCLTSPKPPTASATHTCRRSPTILQPEGKLELPDMDEDLLEIFVQEGDDILDHSDSLMAKLRESPQDRDLVTGLQRDLHTLKGGARMAGLAPIGDLSHAMESLLESISENRRVMDRITVDSLERGFDRLHGLVQRVARRQALAMPEQRDRALRRSGLGRTAGDAGRRIGRCGRRTDAHR